MIAELIEVTKADSTGLRQRLNICFDEWTDRNKRAWLAINVTYCNKEGVFTRRLLTVQAVVGGNAVGEAAAAGAAQAAE